MQKVSGNSQDTIITLLYHTPRTKNKNPVYQKWKRPFFFFFSSGYPLFALLVEGTDGAEKKLWAEGRC